MKRIGYEGFILIWTSLLVTIIAGWCLKEFFKWDTTIIAGVIAFVGAIIGGAITLLGVRKTLDNNNLHEERRANKEALMYLYPFQRELDSIHESIMFNYIENRVSAEEVVRECYRRFSYESKMYEYAQRSSLELYNHLLMFKENIVEFFMRELYHEGNFEMSEDLVVEEVEEKLSLLRDSVGKEIRERQQHIMIE